MFRVDDAVSDRPYRLPSERNRAPTKSAMDHKRNTDLTKTYSELKERGRVLAMLATYCIGRHRTERVWLYKDDSQARLWKRCVGVGEWSMSDSASRERLQSEVACAEGV